LKDLGARLRTAAVPEGLPFDHDGRSLGASSVWSLICPDGEFDTSFRPSGFAAGDAEFEPHALRVRVESVEVLVAALEDVIRLKEAAGRPKDIHVLPILYRFAREKHESGAGDRES
jgi:hypothetical protein